MLSQLSCLLYSFHVNTVSPKRPLASTVHLKVHLNLKISCRQDVEEITNAVAVEICVHITLEFMSRQRRENLRALVSRSHRCPFSPLVCRDVFYKG